LKNSIEVRAPTEVIAVFETLKYWATSSRGALLMASKKIAVASREL
jgi:hypothetical protein